MCERDTAYGKLSQNPQETRSVTQNFGEFLVSLLKQGAWPNQVKFLILLAHPTGNDGMQQKSLVYQGISDTDL